VELRAYVFYIFLPFYISH